MKRVLFAVLALVACNRALEVADPPPAPGPGTISGRAVISKPGRPQRLPASGAEVSLLGSGVRTRCDAQGNFLLEGITSERGQLLFRFDSDANGSFDRQKLVSLEALKAGPGRQLAIGEVLLLENARLVGRVKRGDVTGPSGHAGTLAVVPASPFSATSADDGTYVFDELPEGALSLAFFRATYVSDGFSQLTLVAGQELSVREVVLQKQPIGQLEPARITARVVSVPATSVELATARLTDVQTSMSMTSPVASTGEVSFNTVPGVYDVRVTLDGYDTADLRNVLAQPGETALGDIVLVAGDGGTSGSGGGAGGGGGSDGGTGGGGGGSGGAVRPVAVVPGITAVRTNEPMAMLDGTASYDPLNAGPLIYTWVEQSDAGITLQPNNSLLAATPTYKAPQMAQFLVFELTVTSQNLQQSLPAIAIVEVVAPPRVVVGPTPVALMGGSSAVISAAGSSDPAGAPLTYYWTTDGGVALSSDAGVSVTVSAPATATGYTTSVTLVVSNAAVSADPVVVPVTVTP